MQTGKPFAIFQDRNDIAWGQNWEERINSSLSDVTFLIPIVTPSFFQSPACRSEFQAFLLKEETLGINRLILPLYYVPCDELSEEYIRGSDGIAENLRARNWTDWRQLRFKPLSDEAVSATLATMAGMIKASMNELIAIGITASAKQLREPSIREPSTKTPQDLEIPKILSECQIPPSGTVESGTTEERIETAAEYEVAEARPDEAFDPEIWKVAFRHPYYVYTKKYDEVVEAGELADRAELMKLHKYLSSFVRAMKKLHNTGIAQTLSGFRLTGDQRIAVSVLIDNSGSMRGRPITITAAWSLLIGEWLERLGIAVEILGFTTRAWKGGQSREMWLADGKSANPGRLNDLRHLVYKSFAAGVSVSAPNFAVMMREGLLKENIDGEAVLWAAARLRNYPAERKLLFVLSDGAPVDDSTLSVNPGNFLEKHLRDVISTISTHVTLYAVGIGHDVSRYYPMAVTANDPNDVGLRFFETLIKDPAFLECYHKVAGIRG